LGNSFRQTIAGLFADQRMNTEVMLAGHVSATKVRIKEYGGAYVLVPQDTTTYNYTGHGAMAGLGKLQGKVKGILQHNVLALSETGQPLGILGQEYWSRDGSQPYNGIESAKWERGLALVNRELGDIAQTVVLIQDREGDVGSFFAAPRAPNVELLTRVHEPRQIEVVASGFVGKLPDLHEQLPLRREKRVVIMREGREVTLVLQLSGGAVNVRLPAGQPLPGFSLVIAEEIAAFDEKGENVFDPEQRAVWYLLTSLPVTTVAELERVTEFYALRWRIERLHFTLKTGALNVEKLQFDDLATTINALTFYSIVAWQLLALTYLLRQTPEAAATQCFEEKELTILATTSRKELKTVKAATLALAQLVGFAPSKKQPLPGVKVLAKALESLFFIKIGFEMKPYLKPLQD
jgi:hypothetical protein